MGPKKRTRKDDNAQTDSVKKPAKKAKKDTQKDAKKKPEAPALSTPVDEICPLKDSHQVSFGEDGTPFDATLNQTNVYDNHNKFYRLQLLSNGKDFKTWAHWGRVGERGQSALLGIGTFDDAFKNYKKKFRDKAGLDWDDRSLPPKKGKYTFVEKDYEPDDPDKKQDDDDKAKQGSADQKEDEEPAEKVESKLPLEVQELLQLIFSRVLFDNALSDMQYDANKLPLGKLSKSTLTRGYTALKAIADKLKDAPGAPISNAALAELSNEYYTVIPHSFGRNRPPAILSLERLKKEVELLESLSDMNIANEIMANVNEPRGSDGEGIHVLDRQLAGLNLEEITPLKATTKEYKELSDYFQKSRGETHGSGPLKVQSIFRIERQGEHARFLNSAYGKYKNSDKRLLWHGSRAQNFGGILSQGLRIAPPEAPATGTMFGKGVYLADTSTKSLGYCCAHMSNQTGLMLLCEAELGSPMLELEHADYLANVSCEEKGLIATRGIGITGPSRYKDAGCVHKTLKGVKIPDMSQPLIKQEKIEAQPVSLLYNEYICYDVAQIRLRYLFRVSTKY